MSAATQHLKEGEQAPEFSLLDQTSQTVDLSQFQGRKVLVYFYPKADTPGCTKQSCGLRDSRTDIGDTVVIGISPDEPKALAKFDEKYGLGFLLLSDPQHATSDAYGVWGERSMYGKKYMGILRSSFLIDESGNLARVWYNVSPEDTPANLIKALQVA